MRQFVIWVFIVGISGSITAQPSPQLLFDEANTLLEENEFEEAMAIYHQIEYSGYQSGALFLNMGINAVQLDSLGLAKYYFLKSNDFASTRYSSEIALEYVNSQFSRQSAMLPKLPWDKAVDSIKDGTGAMGVFVLGFISILISLFLVLSRWFNLWVFKKQPALILSFGALSLLLVALAFYVDYVDQRYSEAVIVTAEIQVKQQPDTNADLVSLAYEGYEITIDNLRSENEPNWLYIRLGNGQYGWIERGGSKTL
ncbi:MAG: SH3 domain-containing protein [Balneolales bacterium]|nr:SH3 domain-containing protein [Balneolales bacterium]